MSDSPTHYLRSDRFSRTPIHSFVSLPKYESCSKSIRISTYMTMNLHALSTRRNVPQKAWTGMNPITQRSSTPGQQNGAGPQSKSNTQKTSMNVDPRYMDQYTQERMLHLLGNFMVGCN